MTALKEALARADDMVERSMQTLRSGLDGGGSSFDAAAGAMLTEQNRSGSGSDLVGEQLRNYRGWTFTSIRPIAQRIASQPVHVARLRRRPVKHGGKQKLLLKHVPARYKALTENLEILEHHDLLQVIDNPNPANVRWGMMYMVPVHLELTGKGYWWMPLVNGQRQIWPIPPNWIEPDPQRDFFDNWKLRIYGGMQSFDVPGEEIAYFHLPDPQDPLGGFSPLQAQAKPVTIDEMLQAAQMAGLKNGANPGLAVTIGDVTADDLMEGQARRPLLDREQRQVILDAVKRHYGGFQRTGEPLILDALIKDVKRVGATQQEMAYTDSGAMIKERIMLGFGTNPVICGQTIGGSRAEAATAEDIACSTAINPLAELMSEVLTAKVCPLFAEPGEVLIAWIEPCRSNDPQQKREEVKLLADLRAISRNEVREIFDLPPIAGGDTIIGSLADVPMPIVPRGQMSDEQVVALSGGGGQDALGGAVADVLAGAPLALPAPQDLLRSKAKGSQTAQSRRLWGKLWKASERPMVHAVRQFLASREQEVIDAVRAIIPRQASFTKIPSDRAQAELRSLLNLDVWTKDLQDAVRPSWTRAALTGAAGELSARGKAGLAEVLSDIPRNVLDGVAQQLGDSFSQPYWSDINETTLRRLATEISLAVSSGGGVEAAERAVHDVLGAEVGFERAAMIARTEVTGSLNAGAYAAREAIAEDGGQAEMQWFAMFQNTRDTHAELDSVIVGPGELFDVGGYPAPFPGHWSLPPEERVNCQCVVTSILAAPDE